MILFLVIVSTLQKVSLSSQVECVCTTKECLSRNSSSCLTSDMCYSQWLDKRLTKGCITLRHSRPLLCMNQRPSLEDMKGKYVWPYLVCCNTNRCNENVTFLSDLIVMLQNGTSTTVTNAAAAAVATTTTSMSLVEREALSKFGVNSLEELKKKIGKQEKHFRDSDTFTQMLHLFVIGIGIVATSAISGIGYCILKYKIMNENSYSDQRKKSLKRHQDNAEGRSSPLKYMNVNEPSASTV